MNTMTPSKWLKVSKQHPCSRCEKPDWCTYTEDGAASCCMRVESPTPMHNGGWLHLNKEAPLKPYVPVARSREPESTIDAHGIWRKWYEDTRHIAIKSLGEKLGVEPVALHLIGAAWADEHRAWAFPMKNAKQEIIGIRLRDASGDKWAVKGSKAGLFIPVSPEPQKRIFIVEGPTDTAAALSMNLYAIGRPSCMGQEDTVVEFCKINKVQEVVIIADNDAPGLRGAEKLQGQMKLPSCIWVPPAKDIREFLKFGGNKSTIDSMLRNLVWIKAKH